MDIALSQTARFGSSGGGGWVRLGAAGRGWFRLGAGGTAPDQAGARRSGKDQAERCRGSGSVLYSVQGASGSVLYSVAVWRFSTQGSFGQRAL